MPKKLILTSAQFRLLLPYRLIYCKEGSPNMNKTLWLIRLFARQCNLKKNTLYVTFELEDNQACIFLTAEHLSDP